MELAGLLACMRPDMGNSALLSSKLSFEMLLTVLRYFCEARSL